VRTSRKVLAGALLALSALFVAWMHDDRYALAAMLVFALPPLVLMAFVLRGSAGAAFWSGVIGLGWFSHGIMVAYSRPPELLFALAETALAVLIVVAGSWPGLAGRFSRRKG